VHQLAQFVQWLICLRLGVESATAWYQRQSDETKEKVNRIAKDLAYEMFKKSFGMLCSGDADRVLSVVRSKLAT
jgi:hypothetical protein